jgi:MarR family transcriptional regulator, organic hydroperoxide resistance regulator
MMRRSQALHDAARLLFEVSLSYKRRLIRAAADEGLSPPQAALLWELEPGAVTPMHALASALECDAANVTGLVSTLKTRELVEQRASTKDGRIKLLSTSRKGAAVRARLVKKVLDPPSWLRALDTADHERIRDIIERAKAAEGTGRLG